jgi:hypothetical protein
MFVGMKGPTGKQSSESILALSLAGGIVRCPLKRRQRYRWDGRLSFEKPMDQDADSVPPIEHVVGKSLVAHPAAVYKTIFIPTLD